MRKKSFFHVAIICILTSLFCSINVYASSKSAVSENCGVYGQTDVFTKEQILEMNGEIMNTAQAVNLNIMFYFADKELSNEELATTYCNAVGSTEGVIYLMDISEDNQVGDHMYSFGRAETYYESQFDMLRSDILEILPEDNYRNPGKCCSAVCDICAILKDYAGWPKFHHPRYIVQNMATFDPIGWIESIPSTFGFVVSLIVFLLLIAEVFYFTFDIENPFIGIFVGIVVSSLVNVLVWLVIASVWGFLLWILDHFIIVGCYLYNCSVDSHNKNLILSDSGMERIFFSDFGLLSKLLILCGVIAIVVVIVKVKKKVTSMHSMPVYNLR